MGMRVHGSQTLRVRGSPKEGKPACGHQCATHQLGPLVSVDSQGVLDMRRLFASLLLCAILSSAPASALSVRRMGMQELIRTSSHIVLARVTSVDADAGDESMPRTRVVFERIETIGPDPGPVFHFDLPGGYLADGRFAALVGAPAFAVGETYLFFVRAGEWLLTPMTNAHLSVFRAVVVGDVTCLVTPEGHAVERVDDRGFELGPIITRDRENEVGILERNAIDDAVEQAVVDLRAAGCMPKSEVLNAIQTYVESDEVGLAGGSMRSGSTYQRFETQQLRDEQGGE